MSSSSPYRAGPAASTKLVVVYRSWAGFAVWLLVMAGVGISASLRPYHPQYLVTAAPPLLLGLWLWTIRLRVFHDEANKTFITETLRWPLPQSKRITPLADIVDVVIDEGQRRRIAVGFQHREGITLITNPESGLGERRIRKLAATLSAYLTAYRR